MTNESKVIVFLKTAIFYAPPVIKCSNSSCKTCFFVNTNSSLSNNFNIRLNIHSNSSCHSSNFIYFINRFKCNVFYIGSYVYLITYVKILDHNLRS